MALVKKGKYYYGDGVDDLISELESYSESNKYPIGKTEKVMCKSCGNSLFRLFSDDDETAAVVQCLHCDERQFVRDSEEFLNKNLDNFECICGNDEFQIAIGLSLYVDTNDVRWVYVGGYCLKCGLVGNYIDWNER